MVSKPFLYTDPSSGNIDLYDSTHVKVDPSVKVISRAAFASCKMLIHVDLPEHGLLEHIDAWAFEGCTSLVSIRIPSTVTVIGEKAFRNCTQLRIVELCEGIEQIEFMAFKNCTSLERVCIPSTVKEIGYEAFRDCDQLTNVELCEGLELIDEWAFALCASLEQIIVPSTVQKIGNGAFSACSQLMNVDLCEGLECIESWAFNECTSLERITIPSSVDCICNNSFSRCNNLAAIEFCDEIEQFVHEVFLPWWNHGVSAVSLCTYCFLVQFNIPARLEQIKVVVWKDNILEMMQRIPTMITSNADVWKYEPENRYFESIDSLLIKHEYLQHCLTLLELALWKAKITEQQSNGNTIHDDDVKLLCRAQSFSMSVIIIPNVLSFLVEE